METLQEQILHFMSQGNNPDVWFSSGAVQKGIRHKKKVTQPLFDLLSRNVVIRVDFNSIRSDIENVQGSGRFLYKIKSKHILPAELRKPSFAPTAKEVQEDLEKDTPTSISVSCKSIDPSAKVIEDLKKEKKANEQQIEALHVEQEILLRECTHLLAVKRLLEEIIEARRKIQTVQADRDRLKSNRETLQGAIDGKIKILQNAPPTSIIGGKEAQSVCLNVS